MANEKRLIDANALLYEYCQANGCNEVIDEVCPNCFTAGLIANAPTVDAVEVVHGDWRLGKYNSGKETVFAECSVCDAVFEVSSFSLALNYNYCPNCGAKMDGDGNED